MDNNNAVFNEAPTMMPSTSTSPTMSLTMYPTSYSSGGIMGTESPSSSPTESQSFRSRYWVLGMQLELFFGFVFLLMLLRTWIDKKRGEGSGGGGNGTNSGESSENEGIATQIKKLTTEDWIQLYNKTFDSNGNTTTLTSENIVGHSKDFVDIELGGQGNAADGDGEKKYTGGADGNDDSSSLYLSLDTNNLTSSRKSLVRLSPAEDTKISGTCIICFDEFVAGDEVVWAEGRKAPKHDGDDAEQNRNHHDCKHVFHKDCMVRYLASNSHRRFKKSAAFEGAEGIENPCPTCRQPFCTLSDEDLEMAIQTKLSLLMAEETENNAGGATLPVEQRA